MDVLRTTCSLLACFDAESSNSREANLRRAITLTAQFPTILTAFHRLRQGQELIPPHSTLSHAGNFLYTLTGREPDSYHERVMDAALVLHADHEFNASTFSALVTGSTLSDLYSAVTSGIGTLKGPLHGGANEAVLRQIDEIVSVERVQEYVEQALVQKKKVIGFGHRMYKTYDPRARIFKEYARKLAELSGEDRFFRINERLEATMVQQVGGKGIYPNIDLYSGIVYRHLGIPRDIFTPIFAMARVAGWTAHLLEYWQENRLFRPVAIYNGPAPRKYVPLDSR